MTTNLLERAKHAAAHQLSGLKSADLFRSDRPLYVRQPADNLIPGVTLADFKDDLDAADGNELRDGKTRPAKFCASYSSSALAVNSFAPFKAHPAALTIAGISGFTEPPKFEGKCPNGLFEANGEKSRSPNLDLLAISGDTVVAVESKFLEPLSEKKQEFSEKYVAPFSDDARHSAATESQWRAMYRLVSDMKAQKPKERRFRHLDAAQLVKHYLGLKVTHANRGRTLIYLFWEPTNADDLTAYRRHREEVADFTKLVSGCNTKFIALSYAQLWDEWRTTSPWPGMSEHLARLRERYSFSI